MEKLATTFKRSHGKPILIGQLKVEMAAEIQIGPATTELEVCFEHTTQDRPQGIRIKVSGGFLTANSEMLDDLVLWQETSPSPARLGVERRDSEMHVLVWNVWRDSAGAMQAWIGNSGLVREGQGALTTLRCSDGYGEVSFDDLVVVLRIVSDASKSNAEDR